jgi:hypothetical protein
MIMGNKLQNYIKREIGDQEGRFRKLTSLVGINWDHFNKHGAALYKKRLMLLKKLAAA